MGKAIVVDFTNVKDASGVNPKHQTPGDYRGKIVKADDTPAKSGNAMITFMVQDVNLSSATYPYRCTLTDESLWKLRNIIIASGKQAPKKKIKFDPEKLVGSEIGMTLEDDEYDGKMKSVITAVFPASDLEDEDTVDEEDVDEDDDDDDEEDEPEPPKKKAKAKAKPVKSAKKAAQDDDDEDEDEDLDELDIDDL